MIAQKDNSATRRQTGKTSQARRLRANETEVEYRLWGDLRNRLLNGHKFTRQVPLGPYVVDFLCRQNRLVVELDGFQHADAASDIVRTRWLNANGYAVIRFWNHEVLEERRAVLDTILAVLDGEIANTDTALRFWAPTTAQKDTHKTAE